MVPSRFSFLTRSYYLLCQPSNSKSVFNSQLLTRVPDSCKRFNSNDSNKNNEDKESQEKKKYFKSLIRTEIEVVRHQGGRAPNLDIIKEWQWEELLRLRSKQARRRYYNYLFVTEKKIEIDNVSVSIY